MFENPSPYYVVHTHICTISFVRVAGWMDGAGVVCSNVDFLPPLNSPFFEISSSMNTNHDSLTWGQRGRDGQPLCITNPTFDDMTYIIYEVGGIVAVASQSSSSLPFPNCMVMLRITRTIMIIIIPRKHTQLSTGSSSSSSLLTRVIDMQNSSTPEAIGGRTRYY